ncbi:MAG: efflux RND transporter permease subunit [Phycisphaerales bacterium]|nr:efflux RND transporter permease subunit [Phycisphaerales bacterium]
MDLIRGAISQPVTVAVGVILTIMAGLVALSRIPVQLTPSVEDTIISVSTTWEGASPREIEQEVIDKQEEKLQGLSNLRSMTSESQQGSGRIRMEFNIGTDQETALRQISDKLREVPEYPPDVDEPIVEATDFQNRDFIAWIIFGSTDPTLDIRTLQDFAEDRIRPALERVPGVSEIGVLGGFEREAQIRFDPVLLAQRGITVSQLVEVIRRTNVDVSAGELADVKSNVRVRTISQYNNVEDVENTVITYGQTGGPVLVRDVAEVVETYKEPFSFVRSKGKQVIAINAQREIGSNVIEVMERLTAKIDELNAPGGILDTQARKIGLNGELTLTKVYDQTVYIDQAIDLVQENIWVGGLLAVMALLIFLRSFRSVAIIAISTPISVVGAIVAMVAFGRTVNVISLAGMAFAIGMVVDNAIVILENIYRHIEMGKRPFPAAYEATREVWGAVLAATLTNICVFVPILLIQEEAGQLFRDIALAVCATAALSLLVSVTVVPVMAARMLKSIDKRKTTSHSARSGDHFDAKRLPTTPSKASTLRRVANVPLRVMRVLFGWLDRLPDWLSRTIYRLSGSVLARLAVVVGLTAASLLGTYFLMPPSDYLPKGNRNLVFGLIIPPPGYNLNQQEQIGERVEATIRPFWEAGDLPDGSPEKQQALAALPAVREFDFMRGAPGDPIVPPPIDNYFYVAFDGIMFHGAIAEDENRVVDIPPLFNHATRGEVAPGMLAFAHQAPLFQLGGTTGSAVKIDFVGDDLTSVSKAASTIMMQLGAKYGFHTVQPSPGNFNTPGPELQIVPNRVRLADVGLSPSDLGLMVQATGDGAIIGEYRVGGETIDLKLISKQAVNQRLIENLDDAPMATLSGQVVPLRTLAELHRVNSPPQINRTDRQRSVTLEFTAQRGVPLEQAMTEIDTMLAAARQTGSIPTGVSTGFTGSASKLQSVQRSLLGDGSFVSTVSSTLFLALMITYLVLCVLFQSFLHPLVIMFSVPLATLGGFAALWCVYFWSQIDRYVPAQTMDVLTMLGFIILIGVVVNNAILLVHQALNFMKGLSDVEDVKEALPPRRAIAESVRTRVRPILMSAFTSVLGMAPLVIMPGAGSELYRGLGAVVVGGLLVSTIFTLILVPLLMSLVIDAKAWLTGTQAAEAPAIAPMAVESGARFERPAHRPHGSPVAHASERD